MKEITNIKNFLHKCREIIKNNKKFETRLHHISVVASELASEQGIHVYMSFVPSSSSDSILYVNLFFKDSDLMDITVLTMDLSLGYILKDEDTDEFSEFYDPV
jgi:hypothetical protein